MKAILKRELKSYFSSPIGYVCISVLMALFGIFFWMVMLNGMSTSIVSVYTNMFGYCMMVIPILTMKSMSDDQRNKTDQALLTAPVGVTSIVLGKFLAAFIVYAIAMTTSLACCLVISLFGSPSWGEIFGYYLGSLFYGGAMISIGVFISSLTVSQVISAIATFAISFFILMLDQIGSAVNGTFIAKIVEWISFSSRYSSFTQGLFDISSVVFFLSVAAIFIFVTARRLESKRWS
jgi:ABC-2 type transport system permease protein